MGDPVGPPSLLSSQSSEPRGSERSCHLPNSTAHTGGGAGPGSSILDPKASVLCIISEVVFSVRRVFFSNRFIGMSFMQPNHVNCTI